MHDCILTGKDEGTIICSNETLKRKEKRQKTATSVRTREKIELRWTERKETMDEKREREEIDLMSNVYTLEHSSECAELRLMVDIKTQRGGRIDAISKSPG